MSVKSGSEQPERELGSVLEVSAEQRIAEQLLEQARVDGVKLVGPGGLLAGVTRRILETALETEMSQHLAGTRATRRVAGPRTPATGIR